MCAQVNKDVTALGASAKQHLHLYAPVRSTLLINTDSVNSGIRIHEMSTALPQQIVTIYADREFLNV